MSIGLMRAAAALLVACLAAVPVSAADWRRMNLSMLLVGDWPQDAPPSVPVEIVYMTARDRPGGALYCLEGSLSAVLSLEGINLRAAIYEQTRRRRARNVELTVGETAYDAETWLHKPSMHTVTTMRRTAAARVYNGVVRGDPITARLSARRAVTIEPPAPNDDFADFGADCGIGRWAPRE